MELRKQSKTILLRVNLGDKTMTYNCPFCQSIIKQDEGWDE